MHVFIVLAFTAVTFMDSVSITQIYISSARRATMAAPDPENSRTSCCIRPQDVAELVSRTLLCRTFTSGLASAYEDASGNKISPQRLALVEGQR